MRDKKNKVVNTML